MIKKKKKDTPNLSSSEKLTVGYHQIPNTFNPKVSTKKQVVNDEGLNYNSIDADELNRSNSGLVGLKNLGNTCFINSALQCLLNVQPLMEYFLSDLHEYEMNEKNPLGSQGTITAAFGDLVNQVWCERDKFITPSGFLKVIKRFSSIFGDGSQQDSQEFLIFLLDYLHEDLNRVKEKPSIKDKDYASKDSKEWEKNSQEAWSDYLRRNRSVVVDLFQGQLKSTLKCLKCGAVSHKFETFMYLSVPISEEMQQAGHSLITIDDCIEEFTREETLDETEWWSCTHCNERTPSTKKIDIWKTPNILVVHFKRFSYSKTNKGKINSFIDFKLTQFDLSSQVAGREKVVPIYDLFANHSGSLRGGHYTAYAKNRDYDEWYLFDDTAVTRVANANKTILSAQAYVLFYSKTSPEIFQRQTLTFPEFWPHILNPSPIIHPALHSSQLPHQHQSMSPSQQQQQQQHQQQKQHQNCVHHHTIGVLPSLNGNYGSNASNYLAGDASAAATAATAAALPSKLAYTTLCIQKEDRSPQLRGFERIQSTGFRGIRKGSSNYIKEVMSQLSLNGQLQDSNDSSLHIQELEEENPELVSPENIPIWRVKDTLKQPKQVTSDAVSDDSASFGLTSNHGSGQSDPQSSKHGIEVAQSPAGATSTRAGPGFSIFSFKRINGSTERISAERKSAPAEADSLRHSAEQIKLDDNRNLLESDILREDNHSQQLNSSFNSNGNHFLPQVNEQISFNTSVDNPIKQFHEQSRQRQQLRERQLRGSVDCDNRKCFASERNSRELVSIRKPQNERYSSKGLRDQQHPVRQLKMMKSPVEFSLQLYSLDDENASIIKQNNRCSVSLNSRRRSENEGRSSSTSVQGYSFQQQNGGSLEKRSRKRSSQGRGLDSIEVQINQSSRYGKEGSWLNSRESSSLSKK